MARVRKFCPKRESGGAKCELRAGHKGDCACPKALAAFLQRQEGSIRATFIRLVR